MRVESNKSRKFFWPKSLLKKRHRQKQDEDGLAFDQCLAEKYIADTTSSGVDIGRRSCSGCETILPENTFKDQPARHSLAMLMQRDSELIRSKLTDKFQYRIFVGTWNVGGKTPHTDLDIEQWLGTKEAADIYVLGIQEVVPLNAGNVFGVENSFPAVRWTRLIQDTLNKKITANMRRYNSDFRLQPQEDITKIPDDQILNVHTGNIVEKQNTVPDNGWCKVQRQCSVPQEIFSNNVATSAPEEVGKLMLFDRRVSFNESQILPQTFMPQPWINDSMTFQYAQNRPHYVLTASKQMVGIFLSVWIRADLRKHVHDLNMSCVGCGFMGYFRNKGSISISMRLHETTFCFICSHLSSGQKEGDELRRNSDVLDILRKTHFTRTMSNLPLPESILEHSRIIWFGDLNYRLALSSQASRSLLVTKDWNTLLEKDQLHIEQRAGRVFVGWHEGKICFPPTYKFRINSDCYAIEKITPGGKRRIPAWCDRILWYGKGLHQLYYVRSESKFSDHRPVCAMFFAEVDVLSRQKVKEFINLQLRHEEQ